MTNSSIHVDVNKFLKLLPRYQCHKQVNALQISGIFPNPRGVELHFVDDSVIPFQMTQDWYNKHVPHVGGYLVAYDDGYLSFSPADVFHAGYSRMDEVGTDEDLLERRFWQFDAARKESGDERYTFKGFMRAYAARGVTKHTVGDEGIGGAAPVSIRQLEPAVLPAQIVCYGAQDLYSRSPALTALGNVNLGDQQNLAILYSECLGIAAAENMDFLQLIYFLDIGVRALFRVRGHADVFHHAV